MDAEPTSEADKPKGVFDWRERDFGKRLVPEESARRRSMIGAKNKSCRRPAPLSRMMVLD